MNGFAHLADSLQAVSSRCSARGVPNDCKQPEGCLREPARMSCAFDLDHYAELLDPEPEPGDLFLRHEAHLADSRASETTASSLKAACESRRA
jgi:hypothetical protein